MNPFDEPQPITEIEDIINTKKFTIEIWVEQKGRKCITFVSGWNIEDNIMTDHIKLIKKKNACNGSFKTVEDNKLLQLQGDHTKYIKEYMKEQGIMDEDIKVKGTRGC